jgi:hypothetical protein
MASCNIPIPCDSSVSAANQAAFSITNQGDEGTAIRAHADSGVGVTGTSITGQGIIGRSDGRQGSFFPIGVVGSCAGPRAGVGVFGTGATGVFGINFVGGPNPNGPGPGVLGRSAGHPGVRGEAIISPDTGTNVGVEGRSIFEGVPTTINVGVRGHAGGNVNYQNIGVVAAGTKQSAVTAAIGIYARGATLAGYFQGPVDVVGNLTKSGGGFKIDHPLDPANKYLSHSFVESAEMKNVYDGIALLDERGERTVELPEWVEALNSDFRYQLTPIGGPAPNLHVAREISKNRFTIAGGTADMKVSWQVTGVRRDAWAEAHPLAVEESKSAERGYYLHPDLYRQPPENSTFWKGRADLMHKFEEPEEDLPGTENLIEKITDVMNKMER